jgi:hypothetical protein
MLAVAGILVTLVLVLVLSRVYLGRDKHTYDRVSAGNGENHDLYTIRHGYHDVFPGGD